MVAISSEQLATKRYVRSLVQGEDFSELEFLKQTSSIGLGELQRILNAAAEELQAELTGLVNDEFEGFVKLFNDIGNVGDNEFQDFEDKVSVLYESVQAQHNNAVRELELLRENMARLQRNIEEERRIAFSLKLSRDLERLSKRLNASSLLQDPLDLEIAAEVFVHAKCSVNAASGRIELPEELIQQLAGLTAKFYSILEDTLTICLRKKDREAWNAVAGIHIRIGKAQSTIDAFTNEVWKVAAAKVINKARYAELQRRTPEKAVEALFDGVSQMVQEGHASWFKQLASEFPNQHLFVDCVLAPTFAAITRELAVIFSPALPDVFRLNFLQSCKFIDSVIALLTPCELVALDANEAFHSYARSWQLNVYFQLRFRDTAQALEDVLVPFADSANIFRSTPARPTKHGMLVVLEGLCRDLSTERTVLVPLRPKFFRLRIQCISRASQWLVEQVEQGVDGGEAALSKAWLAMWNHGELVALAKSILIEGDDPLREGMDGEKTARIVERFVSELEARSVGLRSKLAEGFQHLILGSIEKLQMDAPQAVDAIRPLAKLASLQGDLGLQPEFAPSLWRRLADQFVERAGELVGQSRKAVVNFRRLKSIMKEQADEAQQDKEAQQAQLFKLLSEETTALLEFGKTIGQGTSSEAGKLVGLLRELAS